jgi:YbgC/YbaW family acyl-CoA thioester hydrolase
MRESRTTFRVRFGETDMAGIVFYPNFFAYFDLATQALFAGGPVDLPAQMKSGGFGFPIVESGAKFLAPLFYDDEITIVTTVAELRARSLRVEHAVHRGDVLCATGFETRVHGRKKTDGSGVEVTPIPPELTSWLSGSAPA